MYDLLAYARMIADRRRVDAYRAALRASVAPGHVVIEIGTGIGVFAVMAAQMGARRVVAIEPNDAISIARLIALDNLCGDSIEFIQNFSENVTLNEPADLLVADLRGVIPVAATYLASMIDARERLLRPGGIVIPAMDRLFAAVVHAPDVYERIRPSCRFDDIDIDLQSLSRFTTNALGQTLFDADNMLTQPASWAEIDYRTISNPSISGSATWKIQRRAVGHGLAVWFDTTLIDGISLSNAPGQPKSVYNVGFFPWSEPVELSAGDDVTTRIDARFVASNYVWRWRTDVLAGAGIHKARFNQSTFYRTPFFEALKTTAPDHVSELSDEGSVQRFILQAMDGKTSNHEVARRLTDAFPSRFGDLSQALARVGELSQRFSRQSA
jgi:type I protein arginine methyltransferase